MPSVFFLPHFLLYTFFSLLFSHISMHVATTLIFCPSCLVQTDWMWCSFQCSYHSFAFTYTIPLFFAVIWNIGMAVHFRQNVTDDFSDITEHKHIYFSPLIAIVVKVQMYSICPKIIFRWTKSLTTDFKMSKQTKRNHTNVKHFILFKMIMWTRTNIECFPCTQTEQFRSNNCHVNARKNKIEWRFYWK